MTQQYSRVVEEIFEEWLKSLKEAPAIPSIAIEKLRQAIKSGDIESPTKVKKLIDGMQIEVKNHDA